MTISYNSLEIIQSTSLFLLIGYLVGSFSFSIVFSKFFKKQDIREKGSNNAGATNIVRIYGKKIGLSIFLLDMCKPIISILIAWSLKKYSGILWISEGSFIQVAGFATIIGHIWPLFFKFKGGKGVSCALGFLLIMQWPLFIIGILLFGITVKYTKKVSLFSISFLIIIIIYQIYFSFIPIMSSDYFNPIMNDNEKWINILFVLLIWLIILFKHKKNIKKIIYK